MVAVNTIDGIKYGFRLLGYLLAVFLLGGIVAIVGAVLARDNLFIGGILMIVGVVVMYAGALGMLYKVIADGVEAGNRAANSSGNAPPAGGAPAGGPQQGGQPRGGPQGGRR